MDGVSVRAEIAKLQSRLSLVYVRCDCSANFMDYLDFHLLIAGDQLSLRWNTFSIVMSRASFFES